MPTSHYVIECPSGHVPCLVCSSTSKGVRKEVMHGRASSTTMFSTHPCSMHMTTGKLEHIHYNHSKSNIIVTASSQAFTSAWGTTIGTRTVCQHRTMGLVNQAVLNP